MEINLRRTSGGEADTEFLFLISSSIVDVLVFWAFLSHRIERERERVKKKEPEREREKKEKAKKPTTTTTTTTKKGKNV